MEGIGIALDPANNRMFVTDLGGNVWAAALDGTGSRPIRAVQGNLTGIAYAELPAEKLGARHEFHTANSTLPARPVAVIGAGTLGRRIALMFAAHGA